MRLLTLILAFCAILYCVGAFVLAAVSNYGWKGAIALIAIMLISFLAMDVIESEGVQK